MTTHFDIEIPIAKAQDNFLDTGNRYYSIVVSYECTEF